MMSTGKTLCLRLHPAKFAVDWVSGVFSLYLFWQHALVWAVAVTVILPLLSGYFVKRFADMDKFRQSPLGQYSAIYLTGVVRVLMSGGYLVMMLGAWERTTWIIGVGFFIALFAIHRGEIFAD